MKLLLRLIVSPLIFTLILIVHIVFVLKRTYLFVKGGAELLINLEKESYEQTH